MKYTRQSFGTFSRGEEASLWTLESKTLRFTLTDYGAAWYALTVPGRTGPANVLLGFDSPQEWEANTMFLNATIGRFCNRIAGASFSLNGRPYALDANDGANCLHSGREGFHKRFWKSEAFTEGGGVFVRFELESPHGDGGFPGNLQAAVTYGLRSENAVSARYEASVDRPCPLSFTNHAYWNLAGAGTRSVFNHELKLYASRYIELDTANLPSGTILPVSNSPFDFRTGKTLEGVYDHPFIIDGGNPAGNQPAGKTGNQPAGKTGNQPAGRPVGKTPRPAAEVYEPESGRRLTVSATQPALHVYNGGNIPPVRGKSGALYTKHGGFCLETEYYPDSPNRPDFPSALFGPERPYREEALFEFAV